jgi:hypothetical protein
MDCIKTPILPSYLESLSKSELELSLFAKKNGTPYILGTYISGYYCALWTWEVVPWR